MLRVGLCRMGVVDLWFVLWLRVLVDAGLIDFIWLCMLGCVCLGLIILGFPTSDFGFGGVVLASSWCVGGLLVFWWFLVMVDFV